MTTQTTIATIEANLRNTITNSGTVLVRLSDEVLTQMNDVVTRLKGFCTYDESLLDEEQLDIALNLANQFTNRSIGTKITDGYLDLEDPAYIDSTLAEMAPRFAEVTSGFILPIILVNKILNETKSFAV